MGFRLHSDFSPRMPSFCTDAEGWGPISNDRLLDFTPCFEHLVIGIVPKIILFLFGVPSLIKLIYRPSYVAPVGFNYAGKLGTCFLLAAVELVTLMFLQGNYSSNIYLILSHSLSFFAYLFAAALHHYDHFYSRVASSTLLFFWLTSLISNGIIIRTNYLLDQHHSRLLLFALLVVQELLCVLVFLLQNLPKSSSYYVSLEDNPNTSPEGIANIFSKLSFHWMDSLMKLGYEKDLTMEDLWDLKKTDTAAFNSETFQNFWTNQLTKQKPSLLMTMLHCFGPVLMSSAAFKAIQDVLAFTQPQLLKMMMHFVASHTEGGAQEPVYRGAVIALSMLGAAVLQTVVLHQYFHACFITGMRIRSSVATAVYRKSLRLSNQARQQSTVGEITNLMSVDASRLGDLMTYVHILWSGPFQITLAIYFLYEALGVAIFGGVGVMILMIPVNGYLATKARALNKKQMGNKDSRTKLMDELLNGIKVIKLYAWEKAFKQKINKVREMELKTLKSIGYLSAAQSFTWSCTPFLVSFTSFAIYSLLNPEPLTSTKVFVALSLFNLLQFPLTVFPNVISATVEASVSFSRLYKFLLSEELDEDAVEKVLAPPFRDPSTPLERVVVEKGVFGWSKEQPAIQGLNLSCKDGCLVGIVGTVGSGKSTLLSAILGDTNKFEGNVLVRGSMAYVPQTAWIMNASVRDNITFGRPYDAKFYKETIEACGLAPDLEILPNGDATEIGERGINLSGGQKQRISIARAVYSKADIYLFDDPLSAVDAHVGRHIFDRVFGQNGLLKSNCRIFVTHAIQFVPECTQVLMLVDGEVREQGTYQQLMDQKAGFYNLMKEYGKKNETEHTAEPTRDIGIVAPDSIKKTDGQLITKEESAKGSVDLSVYYDYAKACHIPSVLFYLAVAVLSQGLSVFQSVFLSWWADANDKGEKLGVLQPFLPWLLGYGGIGLLYSLFVVVQTIYVWVYCGIRSARVLHSKLLDNILHVPQSFFDTTPMGRILNRFAKDQYTVDEVLPRSFQAYFRTLFSVITVLAVNAFGSSYYLILALPLGYLYAYFQRYYISTSRELKRLDSTSRSPIYAHFQETLYGVSTIRAYAQEGRFTEKNEDRIDFNQKAYYPSVSANRWLAVRLELIGSLIVFCSGMVGVLSIYFTWNLSASIIGLMLTYSLNITQTLNWMVRQSCEIETNIVSVERIKEYTELKQEAPYEITDSYPGDQWPEAGQIDFDHYSTRYRPGLDLVLKDVTVSVKPREKVGIVGRTGAGKSSVTLSLFRIIEASAGTILIDGVDISRLGVGQLRSRLTIIPQDPVLFSGSIRENLDPFGVHTDEALWDALEKACLKPTIGKFAEGLDYTVLQNGENFSVGQRQLICLARALLRKTNILIMDEATAAIDVETDASIQKIVRSEMKDCTVLTIAHRINTVIDSDRILVMDQGRVVEFDAPQQLLKNKKSMFYSLAKQAGIN
ncbi:P-loop containing nucleoside triphosphate hydrolase protein [Gorgonomyces haynaldii]|nr:P-loop containing nucleoside triphosphate hydrolase protein [Gorgonomyces haynaldii]